MLLEVYSSPNGSNLSSLSSPHRLTISIAVTSPNSSSVNRLVAEIIDDELGVVENSYINAREFL